MIYAPIIFKIVCNFKRRIPRLCHNAFNLFKTFIPFYDFFRFVRIGNVCLYKILLHQSVNCFAIRTDAWLRLATSSHSQGNHANQNEDSVHGYVNYGFLAFE